MNQFQTRLAFEQLLDAFGILDAGHLHENLVRALRSVSLHDRLSDTHCIEAGFNDLLRLFGCLFRKYIAGRVAVASR